MGRFSPSPAQAESYGHRQVAKTEAEASIGVAAINAFGSLLIEFVSVAKSNPIIGVILAIVAVNMLYRAKMIDATAASLCYKLVGVAFGVEVALEITEGVGFTLTSIFGGGGTPPDPSKLIAPSATTIVESPKLEATTNKEGRGGILGALSGLIAKVK